MAYTVATAVVLAAFWACPNVAWMQWLLVAGVGFALYGPQMLIGLCGAEVVPKPSVSAANGMLGWISYLGAPPAAPWVFSRAVLIDTRQLTFAALHSSSGRRATREQPSVDLAWHGAAICCMLG